MTISPLFTQIPVRIDVIDKTLNIIQTIYLLGSQPKSVKQVIAKDGIDSKKSIFKHLANPIIKGGIDWEDLDEEDFESMINTDITSAPNEETDIAPVQLSNTAKQIIDYDINVYAQDQVIDLQKKITLFTGIDPSKQYLSMNGKLITQYIEFKSSLDISIDTLDIIDYIQKTSTIIKGIPIDENYMFAKDSSTIINTQSNTLNTIAKDGIHVSLLSLDSIITNKSSIQFLLRSDKQSFELIYHSFVERFFAGMDIQTFTAYLNDEVQEINISKHKKMVLKQMDLVEQLNQIPQVKTSDKNLTITTNALSLCSKASNDVMLSLVRLFNQIVVSDMSEIFYLDLLVTTNNRLKQIRKISKYASQAINFVENISMNVRPLAALVRNYRLKDHLVITLLPSNHFSKLVISIDVFGRIEVIAYSGRSTEITKLSFISEISMYVEKIIEYLNTATDAFLTPYRLNTNLQSYEMTKSTSRLMFSTQIDYENVIKYMISDLCETGLFDFEPPLVQNIKYRTFLPKTRIEDNNKIIQVYSNSKLAVFTLFDLSIPETEFYVDLIGRFVLFRMKNIQLKLSAVKGIQSSDPALYKYKSKMNYSRVCQKKFQPIIATAEDPNAVKYHNFTFNEDQYYKCPSKDNPHLGLLSGYHPNGYCLPCCRKQVSLDVDIDSCISGELSKNTKRASRTSSRYYLIDYPNDMVPNNRLMKRISNVPDAINKMLTKGTKLLVDGISIDYSLVDIQILDILRQYLRKQNIREVVLLIIEYIQDISNHKMILSMSSICYTFANINDLLKELNQTFMKQTIIIQEKNWNDIFIDVAICMKIGIILLVDNRLRSSDCSNVINQRDECSTEPSTSLNSNLKLEKLNYADLTKPLLIILKRIDTEYSRVNRNRRYSYFPIIYNDNIEPQIVNAPITTIEQLQKIKNVTEYPITNIINKSFDHNALIALESKKFHIKSLFTDINGDIAYSEVIAKPSKNMLVCLYRTQSLTIETSKYKPSKYTASIDQVLALIEDHNMNQLNDIDITGFHEYLKSNINLFTEGYSINLPDTQRYLLKVDKFIIHNNKIVGTKFCAIDKNRIIHSIIIYHEPTSIDNVIIMIKTTRKEIKAYSKNITRADILLIGTQPLDLVNRTQSIIYDTSIDPLFHKYFIEIIQNPLDLIDNLPVPINYPTNDTLSRGKYMSSIYRLMINKFIEDWNESIPTELLKAISKLVEETKPALIKNLSNNLVEDWIEKIVHEFGNVYHPAVIRAEFLDLIDFVHLNVANKTKESILSLLKQKNLPINDIELHNIGYTTKPNIANLVKQTAANCLVQTNNIPTSDNYLDKNGKLLILKSIYPELINLAINDLSNQFRREYIINNCLLNSFDNRTKLKSHLDELIYIQEL